MEPSCRQSPGQLGALQLQDCSFCMSGGVFVECSQACVHTQLPLRVQVLPKHPKLRLILMSATLQADLFSEYFGGCPVIQVRPALLGINFEISRVNR